MRRALASVASAQALVLVLAGCAGRPPTTAEERRLVVFAAASLTKVFTQLRTRFEAARPGVDVTFTFDGSSGLVDQLQGGAKADVFASADSKTMVRAGEARLTAGAPVVFARNVLTLVVLPGNPAGITGLDESLAGKKLVVCAPEVPCGSATLALAGKLGVTLRPVSEEAKVTDVLGKVATSGEADAGVVYATDAIGAGAAVDSVAIDDADEVVNDYPISVLAGAAQPDLAEEFIAFVTSTAGRDVLRAAGFRLP